MDLLFNSISTKLKAEVPELRWIDWDFAQVDQQAPPVSWPCCLIDFPNITYSDRGELAQMGETIVSLRFGFKVYERATSKTPQQYKDQALEHLQILNKAQAALQGYEDEHFSALTRTSMSRQNLRKWRIYTLQYSTVIYDVHGSKILTKIASPNFYKQP